MKPRLSPTGWCGAIIVAVVILTALLSLMWTPYDPLSVNASHRLEGPSAAHFLGTDRFGRDVASRLMAGAQITLFVGVIAVAVSGIIGTALGVWAGIRRGRVESFIMRGADILLAFPALLLAIIAGAVVGPSTTSAMVAIGIAGIPGFARVARSGTLTVMTQDYILAARLSGVSWWTIAYRHVLPNISGMLIVQSSIAFALAILAEAALSFLGLGTPPPEPSWGRMLQASQSYLATAPHLAIWPGLAITTTVLGFSLLGDGLRDRLDPKGVTRRA